jgi:hypothetical protein
MKRLEFDKKELHYLATKVSPYVVACLVNELRNGRSFLCHAPLLVDSNGNVQNAHKVRPYRVFGEDSRDA